MTIQPRDTGFLSYKLRFNNTNEIFDIDAPIGIDEMPIKIVQGAKYERHLDYDDSEVEFQPNRFVLGHQFEKVIEYYNTYCFEAYIELLTYVDGDIISTTELDFENVTTNKETYFKCKLKNSDLRTIIEKNKDIKVDLLATKSLNKVDLTPPELHDVNLKPKHIRNFSSYNTLENVFIDIYEGASTNPNYTQGQPCGVYAYIFGNSTLTDIETTNSFEGYTIAYELNPNENQLPPIFSNAENFKFVNDVIIEVPEFNINVSENIINSSEIKYFLRLGVFNYENDEFETITNRRYVDIQNGYIKESNLITGSSGEIFIEKNSKVHVELYFIINYSGFSTQGDMISIAKNSSIKFQATDIYKESTAQMMRLIDSGKTILNNLTDNLGLVDAPRFYEEFREYFVTSGFYVRGFKGESIDLKWSDWLKFIQNAFNCDVQINGNNIFIGKHEDFYKDIEIARFEFLPDKGDDYEISTNERLKCNSFKIKYNKFEDDEKDTLDAFHTKSEWYIPSRIKNEVENEINFIADGYSIEYARREGIEAEPTTSKSKDNDIYIVDCYLTFNEEKEYYTNRSISPGFVQDSIKGIYSPLTVYNLRLSLKRLMIDHYSHYLAELSQKFNNGFPDDSTLVTQNTFFNANGNLESLATGSIHTYANSSLKDNAEIDFSIIKKPIVTPEIYDFTLGLRVKYYEIMQLANDIFNIRGYITFYDENSEMKIYPKELEYNQLEEKLKIKGEKRYGL